MMVGVVRSIFGGNFIGHPHWVFYSNLPGGLSLIGYLFGYLNSCLPSLLVPL
jgi:hypothetical protein